MMSDISANSVLKTKIWESAMQSLPQNKHVFRDF